MHVVIILLIFVAFLVGFLVLTVICQSDISRLILAIVATTVFFVFANIAINWGNERPITYALYAFVLAVIIKFYLIRDKN